MTINKILSHAWQFFLIAFAVLVVFSISNGRLRMQ
jgi:hypothetical protein